MNQWSLTTLQDTARHCKTLQNTAKHCKTLHHIATHCILVFCHQRSATSMQTTTPLYNTTLQHHSTTPLYNTTLQHHSTTPLYNTTLQHIASHSNTLKVGEVSEDALSCRSFSTKEPLILGLFYGTWYVKIRHSMGIRHPVQRTAIHWNTLHFGGL